jgi:hypothetical protein
MAKKQGFCWVGVTKRPLGYSSQRESGTHLETTTELGWCWVPGFSKGLECRKHLCWKKAHSTDLGVGCGWLLQTLMAGLNATRKGCPTVLA